MWQLYSHTLDDNSIELAGNKTRVKWFVYNSEINTSVFASILVFKSKFPDDIRVIPKVYLSSSEYSTTRNQPIKILIQNSKIFN